MAFSLTKDGDKHHYQGAIMSTSRPMTVGRHLVRRLEQAGLQHIFGVPGDYVLSFFDYLEESSLQVVCNCNELNAGYAVDAYARLRGLGGVCVTYGTGGFSVFNAVVGAYAERVPVVVISGGPRTSMRSERFHLHHTVRNKNLQQEIFAKITEAAVVLDRAEAAPGQIDAVLAACLRSRRPVYLEIPLDMVAAPCPSPGPWIADTTVPSEPDTLAEALAEAAALVAAAKNPVILAGIEAQRLGSQADLLALVQHTGFPFATTFLSKSILPEQHPQFAGVYGAALGSETAQQIVEAADVLLCLGTLLTDMALGFGTAHLDPNRMVLANSDQVRIKHHTYAQVSLGDFIRGLLARLTPGPPREQTIIPAYQQTRTFSPSAPLTNKRFYERVNRFLDQRSLVLADTGDSICAAAQLYLPEGSRYLCQGYYMSIGYTLPAVLGAKLAAPQYRPVVFIGDGAFQMTAQELSTLIRQRLNPVIFLINNDGYAVERVINDGPYNDLQPWQYHLLPQVFQDGWGIEVKTEGELEEALGKVQSRPDDLAFIEVVLDRLDCSEPLKKLTRIYQGNSSA
jgi:indolepyruvate decarboxylase